MINDINSYQEIELFFESYIDWITELFPNIPDDHSMKNSEADQLITHEYAIFPSKATKNDLVKIFKSINIPDYYFKFLLSYNYRNIEVPLFSFPPTYSDDNLREINSDIERYIRFRLIPVLYDKSGLGYYCIDLDQEEAIVFYRNNEQPSLLMRKKKLAKSFLSILMFLKEYLDWGGNISGLDSEDKLEALAELKGIDSVIRVVWDEWWLPRLLVV